MAQHLGKKKDHQRRWRRKKVAEARLLGNCVYCFKRPQLPGLVKCEHCQKILNASAKRRQHKMREAWRFLGLCHRCGKEAVPEVGLCAYHIEKRQEYEINYRNKLKENGKCFACGHDLDEPGFKRCLKCRLGARARWARSKRIGKGKTVLQMAT